MTDSTMIGPAPDPPDEDAIIKAYEAQFELTPSPPDESREAADKPEPLLAAAAPEPQPAVVATELAAVPPPVPIPPSAPQMQPLPQPQPREVDDPPPLRVQKPERPSDKHFAAAGALSVGYWMSVGVGAVGQIASFGGLIAGGLDGWMKVLGYAAAALGAAFAEITMIGSGASSLKRRYKTADAAARSGDMKAVDEAGSSWKPLLLVSCLVCAYATTLNVLHWAPIQIGLAVMFGGGSLVGFTAHTMAEHLAAKEYETRLVEYYAAVAERDAKVEALAAAKRRAEDKALRDVVAAKLGAASEITAPMPVVPAARAVTPKPVPAEAKAKEGRPKLTADVALAWAREHGDPGPAEINRHFEAKGYQPVDSSTIRRWRQAAAERSK